MRTTSLILPDNPLFGETLASSWGFLHGVNPTQYYVTDSESGLARPATASEVQEYLNGGEYDEVTEDEEYYELD